MIDKVAIILVNWNGWEDTIECIESIQNIDYENYQIIIVDNASSDDSIKQIISYCQGEIPITSKFLLYSQSNKPIPCYLTSVDKPTVCKQNLSKKSVYIIKNSENSGFAVANNIGIEIAVRNFGVEYVLLLNNDTVVEPGFLRELLKYSKNFHDNCILGPKILYYDNPQRIWLIGKRLFWLPWNPWHNIEDIYDKNCQYEIVEYISGCCLLISKYVIQKIGLLPTEYFLQWEDIDYCFNAQNNGINIVFVPGSVIYHKVSSTYKKNKKDNLLQVKLGGRNRIIFWKKYLPAYKFNIFFLFFITIVLPIFLIYYSLFQRNSKKAIAFSKGIIEGFSYSK